MLVKSTLPREELCVMYSLLDKGEKCVQLLKQEDGREGQTQASKAGVQIQASPCLSR